jgi:hypothetical protein
MILKIKKIFNILIYTFALVGFAFTCIYFAVKFGFTNTSGVIDEQRIAFLEQGKDPIVPEMLITPWRESEEWGIIKTALQRDKSVIEKAAHASGVPARMIVAQLVVEQLRLFNSEREAYKTWFQPLKILGSQTQFSWGVMGIKEETAILTEQYLKGTTSPFYLGTSYENILDFKTTDIKNERFTRMTDQHDHYYSYLYAGLFLKQIITQWNNAGFDISNSTDILATLYNLGYSKSQPHANPQSGGALITVGGTNYSFGSLAAVFYYSTELSDVFPRPTK